MILTVNAVLNSGRVRDWLHGVRAGAPDKETQNDLSIEPCTEAERLRLVYLLITNPLKDGGAGITPKSGDWVQVESIFALHNHQFNKEWIKEWSTTYNISNGELSMVNHLH
jgi:anoctamin-10